MENCQECLRVAENGNPNINEQTRQVDHGENPTLMNPRNYSAIHIDILTTKWRAKFEEHERGASMSLGKEQEERAHEVGRQMRHL